MDQIFSEHYNNFHQIAQFLIDNQPFYEWFDQEYDSYGINMYKIEKMNPLVRDRFFTDSEWEIMNKMFSQYGLYYICMKADDHAISFDWIVDLDTKLTGYSYYYNTGDKTAWHWLIQDYVVYKKANDNWYGIITKRDAERIKEKEKLPYGSYFYKETVTSYDNQLHLEISDETNDKSKIRIKIIDLKSDKTLYSFTPFEKWDLGGVCFEKDNYNIWIQSVD